MMMETVLIFLPRSLTNISSGRLVGVFSSHNDKTWASDTFYVLAVKTANVSSNFEDIGFLNLPLDEIRANYVSVSSKNGVLVVDRVVKEFQDYPLSKCHIIQYDESSLIKSELYLQPEHLNCLLQDSSNEGDYFKVLAFHLKRLYRPTQPPKPKPAFLRHILSILQYIAFTLDRTKLSSVSSIGLHVRDFAINLKWFLEKIFEDKWITLQSGNIFLSLLVDIAGGIAVVYALENVTRHNNSHIFRLMATKTEELLEFIKYMIKWLMGSPAGLKLNYPLNYILGNFFLYNIYLWWTFLGLIRPLLEIGFSAFLKLGFLGIALQIAILADIFSLVTFHLFCIYIYAARLYEFQIKGIISLSKIFLGRKRNPEPDKVDSCPYSTEQLFVGTVCFTVLLFLLPTTLVYYVVFTLIRLGFIFFGGILTRARYLLQILPLYSSIIWMVYPKLVITTTKLVPVNGLTSGGVVTLIALPDTSSWFDTMSLCVPDVLLRPKPVSWKAIVENVLSGKLMYPV